MVCRIRHFVNGNSGSGIGRACALSFAKEGASGVVVADLDLENAGQVATEIRGLATHPEFRVEAVQIDVTSESSVRKKLERVRWMFERIDYCVNCAGVSTLAHMSQIQTEAAGIVRSVHKLSACHPTKAPANFIGADRCRERRGNQQR